MKKILSFLLVLIALFSTLTSCQIIPNPPVDPDNGGGDVVDPTDPADPSDRNNVPDENYTSTVVFSTGSTQEDDFINLFSADVKVELRLDISDEQLSLLQSDYEKYSSFGSKSPIYRKANLYVKMTLPNGNVKERFIEEVGVRMKGNTSRTDFYNSNDGMYNLIHLKISFGETFDKE